MNRIEGLDELRSIHAKASSAFARYGSRRGYFGMAKLFSDDDEDEHADIQRPVIDGVAAQYNVAMFYNGQWTVFNKDKGEPGCFAASIARGDNVKLQVDHNNNAVLADKHSGFEVFETDTAVTFRATVGKTKNPMGLLGVVASKNRRCASVQCDIQEYEMRTCGGKQVKFVTKAKLNEVSLVKLGLNSPSFAFITDGAKTPAPSAKVHSAAFVARHAAYKAERSAIDGDAALDQWNALSDRLSAIERQLEIPSEAEHKAYIASILRGEHDAQYMKLAPFRR